MVLIMIMKIMMMGMMMMMNIDVNMPARITIVELFLYSGKFQRPDSNPSKDIARRSFTYNSDHVHDDNDSDTGGNDNDNNNGD